MSTYSASSASHTSPMPPTSDPLKLFMEDIEKAQTLSGKYVKIQAYLVSLKEEKHKINGLDGLPISKQFLDHAIKALGVEHDFVSEKIKNILNQTGITDVDVLPEEMIRVFQNPSLNQNNTVPQAPQVPMQSQQGLGQQGLGQQGLGQQGLGQQGLGKQGLGKQGLGQQGSLQREPQQKTPLLQQYPVMQQPQINLSHLQHQQRVLQLQEQVLKKQIQQQQAGSMLSQTMKPGQLNPQIIKPNQLPQHQELLQHVGQQVFGQQNEEKRPLM